MSLRHDDTRFETEIRQFLDLRAADTADVRGPDAIVAAIARRGIVAVGRERRLILVWALIVAALLAMGIGATLLGGGERLAEASPAPAGSPEPSPAALPGTGLALLPAHDLDCPPAGDALPEGVLMEAGVYAEADPTTDRPGHTLTLFADGLLITTAGSRTRSQVEAADPAMTSRRLSPRGLDLLLGAVAESGLLARGCHLDLLADTPLRGIAVRATDGASAETHWGQYGGMVRPMSDEETAAAGRLVERIEHLEDWLPPDAWVDSLPRPHDPGQWLLSSFREPDMRTPAMATPPGSASALPDVTSVVLPEGSTLLDFGTEWREPDLGSVTDGYVHRCEIVGTDQARAIAARLSRAGTADPRPPDESYRGWWFADGSAGIAIDLEPVLPTTASCPPSSSKAGETRAPVPPAGTADSGTLDACALVPIDEVSQALDMPALGILETHGRGDFMLDMDYVSCGYWDDGDGSTAVGGGVTVAVRTVPTSTSQAAELARMWLGADAVRDEVAGRPAWLNTCMASPADAPSYCVHALAVIDEPGFVVMTIETRPNADGVRADSAPVARRLLAIVFAALDDLGTLDSQP